MMKKLLVRERDKRGKERSDSNNTGCCCSARSSFLAFCVSHTDKACQRRDYHTYSTYNEYHTIPVSRNHVPTGTTVASSSSHNTPGFLFFHHRQSAGACIAGSDLVYDIEVSGIYRDKTETDKAKQVHSMSTNIP